MKTPLTAFVSEVEIFRPPSSLTAAKEDSTSQTLASKTGRQARRSYNAQEREPEPEPEEPTHSNTEQKGDWEQGTGHRADQAAAQ